MTLTPLQSLAADFPGPKFHTNRSSDVQKTLSPPWSNQHVLVAGGFKNGTNFSSIRSTRLSFCLALQFVFKSESKSQFIVVEIWNHAQILNFVTFMPNFYLRLISNLWWNLSIKNALKRKSEIKQIFDQFLEQKEENRREGGFGIYKQPKPKALRRACTSRRNTYC